MIRDNIKAVREHISSICRNLNKDPGEITLVGVTKYADADQIKEAVEVGLTDIGENRVQDAQKKFPILDDAAPVTKHFIGHLQTNKVKQALEIFDIIQSVDSLRLAQEIDKRVEVAVKTAEILFQVNTSGEDQKFGISKSKAIEIIKQLQDLKNIRVLGLMTIAPLTEDKDMIRACFRDLRLLFEEINTKFSNADNITMKYLSMGMTNDYEIALEEGANMVRIGSAIFKNV